MSSNEVKSFLEDSKRILGSLEGKKYAEEVNCFLDLWAKLLSNTEAILVLLDSDFRVESKVLYRISLENLFNIFALLREPKFFEKFKNSSNVAVAKTMRTLDTHLRKDGEEGVDADNVEKLRSSIEQHNDNPIKELGYSIYEAATVSKETSHMYENEYRLLSISHAHSTYLSVISPVEEKDISDLLLSLKENLQLVLLLVEEQKSKFT